MRPGAFIVLLALAAPGGAVQAQKPAAQEWAVPKEERERTNPLAPSDDALRKGRVLYQRNCAMCHGDKGKGDGPAARMHAERSGRAPKDLTDPQIQLQITDGEIFWKVSTGFKENGKIVMPAFGAEIANEADRWKLVLFVRAFGKTTSAPEKPPPDIRELVRVPVSLACHSAKGLVSRPGEAREARLPPWSQCGRAEVMPALPHGQGRVGEVPTHSPMGPAPRPPGFNVLSIC